MTRATAALLCATLSLSVSGCSECAGTPSCHTEPQISYSGQLIVHKTGAIAGGVSLKYVRRSGIDVDADTLRAISSSDGFFRLQTGSVYIGSLYGDLTVTPPAPYPAYTIPNVRLSSSRTRGDGGYLGRIVVDPFLILVGEVHDRATGAVVSDVSVTLRRTGGGRLSQDVMTFTSDGGGRFAWIEPQILQFGEVDATWELQRPGSASQFVKQPFPMGYQDATLTFVVLFVDP